MENDNYETTPLYAVKEGSSDKELRQYSPVLADAMNAYRAATNVGAPLDLKDKIRQRIAEEGLTLDAIVDRK